jgi:hypothetical protein
MAQTKGGLSVALEPIMNRKALKTCFGVDLVSKGFIPILVVAENRDTGRSFILLKEEVSISLQGSERQAEEAGNVHSGESKAAEALAVAGVGAAAAPLIVGVSVPPAVPALFLIAVIKGSKAEEIRHRVVKNELRSETLSPGRAVHGFLYFPLKRGKERIPNLAARVTFITVPENQRSTFDFALSGID